MEVQVRGKGVVVTDALREYADRKVNKLTNHFQHLRFAHVTQVVQGKSQKVEVTLDADGVIVRGEESGEDLYAAIDQVVDKLERQLQKYKGKKGHNGHQHHHAHHHHYGNHGEIVSPRKAPVKIDGLEEEPEIGRIVRKKRFNIKPLSPDEAVEQMELLSHDFFVFENAETNEVNVLYRRDDGNYGILEPER
jgi:putative sigma-54 modulation protein